MHKQILLKIPHTCTTEKLNFFHFKLTALARVFLFFFTCFFSIVFPFFVWPQVTRCYYGYLIGKNEIFSFTIVVNKSTVGLQSSGFEITYRDSQIPMHFLKYAMQKSTKTNKIMMQVLYAYFSAYIVRIRRLCCAYSSHTLCIILAYDMRILRVCCAYPCV